MNFYKIFFFVISVFIFVALIWKSGFLNINQVDIEKNHVKCINDQEILLEFKIKGENIFLIDEQNINKKILSKYPCIKNIIIEKKFPNKLKIILNGRKGMAIIANFKYETLINLEELEATAASQTALIDWSSPPLTKSDNFIVDNEGIIFAKEDESKLPYFYITNQILKIGNIIENIDFQKVSLLFMRLPQMDINITQTKINEQDFQILGEQKIIFSLEKDILQQLASLQLILERAKIENRNMEMIDLRFDKPVVKYLPKK